MEEKKNTKKWVTGCGIGCGVVLVIAVAGFFIGYRILKNKFEVFDEVEILRDKLAEQYGDIQDYCPPPDFRFNPGRIRIFLRVRQDLSVSSRELRQTLENLRAFKEAHDGGDNSRMTIGKALKGIGSGFDLAEQIGHYYRSLYDSLLLHEMPPAEYWFLHISAFWGYLGHSPEGSFLGGEERPGGEKMGPMGVKIQERDEIYSEIRSLMARMLRCRLEKGIGDPQTVRRVRKELKRISAAGTWSPWKEGLPPSMKKTFDAHREELKAAFTPMAHFFETVFLFSSDLIRDGGVLFGKSE